MYKHSTTHRTLSRRLAALLAVLALLAAMALPVYAATQNEDTTQKTLLDVSEDTAIDTIDGTALAEVTKAEKTRTDGENEASATDPAQDETAVDTEDTEDTAGESTAPAETNISDISDGTENVNATQPTDDAENADAIDTQPAETADDEIALYGIGYPFYIYFAVPENFNGGYAVKFKAKYGGKNTEWTGEEDMELVTDSTYSGRKVYRKQITQDMCKYGGFHTIQFRYYEGNTYKDQYETKDDWKTAENIANKLFDAQEGTWTAYTPFNPNNHQSFAGKTMLFQNQSGHDLTNVKAVFYEKTSGELQVVDTIDLDTVTTGKRVSFKIPKEDCSYIRFLVDEKETSLYNFYGQQDEEGNSHFLYDSGTACCYVYKEGDIGSSWTIPQGKITVYFDATFSSACTEGDANLLIPRGGSSDVYYCLKKDNGETSSDKMTPEKNNLYSVVVPEGYSKIMFSGDALTSPANSGISTDWVSIDWSLKEPCYVADTNDAVVYNNNAPRGGYWTEKDAVRDAEAGKGTTVVDIDKTTSFVQDSGTKYVNSTLYDYYTDWELNGNNRDAYDNSFNVSDRSWVPFRQFNLALSDYYKTSGASSNSANAATYPIYTGHFQPSEYSGGFHFVDLHNKLQMNLFGFGEDEGRKFMVDNNSSLCTKDGNDTGHSDCTVQGIVADNATNTSKDGLPVMRGTEESTNPLVEPHFNTDFLRGNNSKHTKLGEVYENVAFPFTQNDVFGEGIKYWSFDAAETTLYLKQDVDDDSYFLQSSNNKAASINRESNSTQKGATGFFPFNETVGNNASANNYNYGFGARLQFNFALTDDGKVEGTKEKTPIKFFFSGDDDVWVFIDGKLALDVGGAHAKASGLLVFSADDSLEYATAYVSNVKAGGTSKDDVRSGSKYHVDYKASSAEGATTVPIDFNYTGATIKLEKGKTHTLTMYYMERGMWESNMAIAFNFPDHNELQVEKKVELGDVKDEKFVECFTNQKLFNFTILNQATHYGTTPVDENSYKQAKPIELTNADYSNLGRMNNQANTSNNYCQFDPDPDKNNTGQVIHWYAKYNDTGSDYRDDRMGVITLKSTVDITGMDYLSFFLYASGKEGEGTLSLSNMYLQLVDSNGKVLGCIDKQSLSGTTYNLVDPENNKWINIKLDLSRLIKAPNPNFDMTKLKEIRIGDNYQRDIYFKDFTFTANPTIPKITGFTTEQDKIPDYDSAKSGELKPAVNAQFSSSVDGKTRAVDKNGQFTLQDKEVVTFSDQFRRGSYLSVTEDADPALFDTTWTIYENGVPVTSMNTGTTVENAIPVPNVVGVSSYTPNDGRIEKPNIEEATQSKNAYKNAEKPAGDKTIVFRSYSSPDSGENGNLAKLKLQFVNKVKTGSLTIKKQAAADEDGEISTGTYTFTVTFTDVGGLGLESKPIKQTVTIKGIDSYTISGIPVGTRFHIEETTASNKANVSKVEVSGGGKDCKVVNGKEAIGSIVEDKQGDPSTVAVATFTNTTRTLIDIDLTKKWVDAAGNELTGDNLPDIVYVQLQRKTEADSDLNWKPVEGTAQSYVAVKRVQKGWTHSFTNLDANDYTSTADKKPVYQYRVVEGVLVDGEFVAKNPETDALLLSDGYTYTYNGNEMQTTTTADGKTSNTITLTNKRLDPKFTLDITKKDAENVDTLLKNVEFKLEKMKDDNGKLVVDESFNELTGVTNEHGELMWKKADGNEVKGFTNLEAGTYRLTETKAAENYNLLSAPIEVEFTKTGQCLLNSVNVEVSTKDTDKPTAFIKNGNDSYTLKLTVLNRKTPALPHTGADAPSLWLLIGLPLAVAGLLILVFRYNKKGGRTR